MSTWRRARRTTSGSRTTSARRQRRRLFLHFALTTAEPAEEFKIALAGPAGFRLALGGIGFRLNTVDGYPPSVCGLRTLCDGQCQRTGVSSGSRSHGAAARRALEIVQTSRWGGSKTRRGSRSTQCSRAAEDVHGEFQDAEEIGDSPRTRRELSAVRRPGSSASSKSRHRLPSTQNQQHCE